MVRARLEPGMRRGSRLREGLVVLPRADLRGHVLRALPVDRDPHRHARADDLEHAGPQVLPLHRVRFHVRDPHGLRDRQGPGTGLSPPPPPPFPPHPPHGPRGGPGGGPAGAFPPSTSTSRVSGIYFSSSFCRTRTLVPGTVTGIRTIASNSSTVTSSFVSSIFITRAFSPLNGPAISSTMSPSIIPLTTGFGARYISMSSKRIAFSPRGSLGSTMPRARRMPRTTSSRRSGFIDSTSM